MRNIAIIPARSGSKGLKDKNIKILEGKPLLAYSIEAANESGIFDEVMVSTDSKVYAEIACKYGANVPFLRTEELSNDVAGSWDVVKHVLNKSIIKRKRSVCHCQCCLPSRYKTGMYLLWRRCQRNDLSVCFDISRFIEKLW